MQPTLADIAEALNVSKMTVSRAINNHPAINAATRDRVLVMAEKMGYRPNQHARALATNRSYLIGLLVPDLMHSYFAEIAKAVESVVRPAGYEILLCHTEENAEKEMQEVRVLRHRTDGLIIASALDLNSTSVYRKLIREGTNLVFFDRYFEHLNRPAVITDNVKVGLLATQHLIELGHRRIGHLSGPAIRVATDRLEGYRQALGLHKIQVDQRLIRAGGVMESDGYQAMKSWIKAGNLPTAIFAVNDPTAIGAMMALREAGLRTPHDLAIVGAGNIHYGDMLQAPLTTVSWNRIEMGEQAARLLMALIEGKLTGKKAAQQITVSPELLIRQSCGANLSR